MLKYVLLILSLSTLSLVAMEKNSPEDEVEVLETNQPTTKKARVENQQGEVSLYEKLNTAIYNIDHATISNLVEFDSVNSLTIEQKASLFKIAANFTKQIEEVYQKAKLITEKTTDPLLKQKFDHSVDLMTAKKTESLFNALQYLKGLKFPQSFFSPKPYSKGPHISLDLILESLIKAEQLSILSCCFHITLHNIAKALVDKKQEGVEIDIVTNQKQGDQNPCLDALKLIAAKNITLWAPKGNAFEMNHHKFFIFGCNVLYKQLLWTGSYNPTGHSNEHSWDDVILLDTPEVIQNYCDRFDEIKNASKSITLEELEKTPAKPSFHVLAKNKVPKDLWK